MFCPFCGTDNASDQKYCRNCGAMLPVATKASSKPSATGTKKNSVGFPTGTNSLSSAGTSSFVPPQPPNLPKPAKSLPLPSLNEAVGSKRKEEVAPPDAPALDSSKNMGHQPTVNLNDADDFDPNSLLESFYETQPTFNASLNRQKIDPSKHPDVDKAFMPPPPPPPPLPSSTPVSKAGTFIPETTGMPRLEEVVDSTIQMASVSADEALLESLSTTAVPVSTSQKNTPPPAESENKKKDEKASFSKTLIGHPMSDPLKQSEITLDAPVGDASAGATNHFGSLAGDKGASSPETLFMDVPPFRDEDDTETIPSARLSDIFGNVAIPGLSKNFAIPGPPPPPPPPTSVGIDTAGSAEEQNLETLVLNKSELKDVEDAAMKAAATTLMAPSNVTNSSAGSLDSPTTVYMPPNNPRQFDEATEVLKNSPIKDETTDELDKKTRVSLPKPEGFGLDVASTIAMPSLSEPDTESYPEVMQQAEIRQRMEAEAQMQMPPVAPRKTSSKVVVAAVCAVIIVFAAIASIGGYYIWNRLKKPVPVVKTPDPVTTPKKDTPVVVPPGIPEAPPNMVLIPAGEYLIGTDQGDETDEDLKPSRPEHKVKVGSFYIDIYEVTKGEYAEFIKATGRPTPADWVDGKFSGRPDEPVTNVSWEDADAYAKWAGKRLPTEQEWEIAASGKQHFMYPWGNEWKEKRANTLEANLGGIQPVGSMRENKSPFGVFDMCGNVWEWTADTITSYPGSNGDFIQEDQKENKIIRGGAYSERKQNNYFRNWVPPNTPSEILGFRCVKDAK